jgi:hypothetical protein
MAEAFLTAVELEPGACYTGANGSSACGKISMEVRYHVDPDTGQPHIYGHGVTEKEVEEVLRGRGQDVRGTRDSRRKIGQTMAGRYLQVFYVPDEDPESIFVLTAYEPRGKAKRAFRRRQRRKPK